jgi:hypothetical protein
MIPRALREGIEYILAFTDLYTFIRGKLQSVLLNMGLIVDIDTHLEKEG